LPVAGDVSDTVEELWLIRFMNSRADCPYSPEQGGVYRHG